MMKQLLVLVVSTLGLCFCAGLQAKEADSRDPSNVVALPANAGEVTKEWLAAKCNVDRRKARMRDLCFNVLAAQLPPFDPAHPELFGEHYNPREYYECKLKRPTDSACDRFALRRPENPEYWPEGSTRITWPEAPKESVYREGMNGQEYFDALCKAEAGEFIYKTVENVAGIYQIRPRVIQQSNDELMDRWVIEDPYGRMGLDQDIEFSLVGVTRVMPSWVKNPSKDIPMERFPFLETSTEAYKVDKTLGDYRHPSYFEPKPVGTKVVRFFGYNGESGGRRTMQLEYDRKIKARYGFVWRGISRSHDRELGIAGSELAVVDLKSGEILGIRRAFQYSASKSNRTLSWLGGLICPNTGNYPINHIFLFRVLKPADAAKGEWK